jgi:hypothetical protein
MRRRDRGGVSYGHGRDRPGRVRAAGRQGEGHRHRPVHRRPQSHGDGLREVPLHRPHPREDPEDRHVEGEGAALAWSRSSRRRICPTSATAGSSRIATSSRRTPFGSRARSSPGSPRSPRRSPQRQRC